MVDLSHETIGYIFGLQLRSLPMERKGVINNGVCGHIYKRR